MAAEQHAAEEWPPYITRDGRELPTTKWHWYQGKIALCPVCDCGPCDPECEEQAVPAPRRVIAAVSR